MEVVKMSKESGDTVASGHDQINAPSVQIGDTADSQIGKAELDSTEVDIGLQLLDDASVISIDPAIERQTLRKIDVHVLPLLAQVALSTPSLIF
jgi:hypothetical protein